MKRNQFVKFLAASSLLGASSLSATVTPVGVDSTTGPNWRTAANLEPDNEYGTAGYVIFGLNEADSVYNANFDVSDANPANAYNLPAEISISTSDVNIGMWSGNGNFGTMEDPGNGNTLTSAPVLANTGGTKQFTITRAANGAFRITIIVASGDNEGTEYTVAVDDSSGSVNSNYDHVANGLAYHVFDVSEGDSDIQINITSTTQNRSLMGIAFDGGVIDITDPTDSNSNGIGDNWETFYFGSLGVVDPGADEEPDGLTNLEEWQNLTRPMVADTDSDGLEDGEEVDTYSTDPTDNDTDGDGYDDKFEVTNSSDPTDSTSLPPVPDGLISVDLQGSNEGALFPSEPVLMSGFEVRAGIVTDVWNAINIPGHPNTATDPSFDLLDSNGDETGVSLSFTGTISSWSNTPGNDPLTNDYLFVNAGNADVSVAWELSGLSPLSEFTLFTYGGLARDMLLTVDTDGDGDLTNETPTNIDINGFEFTGTVGANGSILGSIDPGASNEANWGGFQLIHTGSSLSGLRVTDIRHTDIDTIELTWTSKPGRSYTVESSLNMVTWTPLLTEIDATPSPGTITTVIVDTPAANELRKFYRVVRE
ncbi:hypothetical protein OAL53_02460 [Akkermansiaceae bacterium]|jgi:hypothetical protein|nr:hypothetical protein [Akkermansiaceae bacterium]MDB4658670.1 hypothetical protein [bacterium]MDA7515967.1 hypothetical protein [Akkermansiaceae bacterium]MDB4622425.1 hypothetical protein [Akkermansiaceae bacterium]MDB4701121.1 hypothetical protein [Akkermansiaceae bacterium]